MDGKDYILEYADFTPKELDKLNTYIISHINNPSAVKIHIKKWNL